MIRRPPLYSGCVLLAVALATSIWLAWLYLQARHRDVWMGAASSGPCLHPLVGVSIPRIMSERESHVLQVHLAADTQTKCTATIEVGAAGFEISPPETTRSVELDKDQPEGTISWVLAPRQAGEYIILIASGFDTRRVGIVVTNVFGLSARTALVITWACYALGSALTIPWWLDRLKRRRRPSRIKRGG